MSRTTKIIIGIVIGIVVLGASCVGGIIALGYFVAGNTPEGITLLFEYPDDVIVGDEFELTITVQNHLPQQRTLGDLDFYPNSLDGVTIKSINPRPNSDDGTYTLGMRTMTFNRPVPPNGELPIVITMTADQAGFFTGDVDITIDGMLSIYSTTQTLVINEPE
ncbi:MAG: hypothetical protein KDA29_10270 [Phycisphaerales bacterium]|nr:hypothetical protein [Phycisphaerales bacterium]